MIDDIERLDDALEGRAPAAGLSDALDGLVGVAAEVARVLAAPLLTAAERDRLYQRALEGRGWQGRLRHDLLPRLARRPTMVGGAAAVTLAVVGIALLRGRSHPEIGGAAA